MVPMALLIGFPKHLRVRGCHDTYLALFFEYHMYRVVGHVAQLGFDRLMAFHQLIFRQVDHCVPVDLLLYEDEHDHCLTPACRPARSIAPATSRSISKGAGTRIFLCISVSFLSCHDEPSCRQSGNPALISINDAEPRILYDPLSSMEDENMISNILVATDGSDTAGRAVDLAAYLAARLGASLTVGHVLQHGARAEELNRMAEAEHLARYAATEARLDIANTPGNMDALFTGSLSGADKERAVTIIGEQIANRAASRAKDAGAKDVSTRVVNGDYDEGLLGIANDVGADTIVIGQRGLGRLRRIFQGSVSQKVNQQAECTVVTVR